MAVVTEREFGLFIDGELVEPASGDVRELREPATGDLLARAAMAGEADVDRAVEADRKALADLETRNVGKAISSVKAELAAAVEYLRFYASATASIAGRANPIGGSLLFYSLKEPVGVCGQIVPWNYPAMKTTWKLAP